MTITRATIRSAEDRYPQREIYSAAECFVVEAWLHHRTNDGRMLAIPGRTMPEGMAIGVKAPAYVNRGRWMVRCPGHDVAGEPCWGAQEASREDKRYFCIHCGNAEFGGLWVTVEWPEDAAEIEELVGMRPSAFNRNCPVGKTAEDVRDDNETYGVQ